MTQQQSRPGSAEPAAAQGEPAGTDELRDEIERTRRELGDTVEALAAKTDVKAMARDAADRMKAGMSTRSHRIAMQARARRTPIAAAGAGALSLAVAAVIVRRRIKGHHITHPRRFAAGKRRKKHAQAMIHDARVKARRVRGRAW